MSVVGPDSTNLGGMWQNNCSFPLTIVEFGQAEKRAILLSQVPLNFNTILKSINPSHQKIQSLCTGQYREENYKAYALFLFSFSAELCGRVIIYSHLCTSALCGVCDTSHGTFTPHFALQMGKTFEFFAKKCSRVINV